MKNQAILAILIISILISGCPGSIDNIVQEDLGYGYYFHEVTNIPTISNVNTKKGIPGVVVSYNNNNSFLIALEKDLNLTIEEENNLIKNGKYYKVAIKKGIDRYWIIDYSIDSIFGPMERIEYVQKREALGISKELVLK